jgi:DNA invertase Pin-like site-specific DNA recombinase
MGCRRRLAAGAASIPADRLILVLLSGLAEEERTRILKRANEGRVAAIKRGTRLGRKIQTRRPSAAGSHRPAQSW